MSYSGLGIQTLEQRTSRVAAATENQRDLARTLYSSGQSAYDAGSYEVALGYFSDAWTTLPHPAVLLAIGAAMQRLGRFQDAAYRFQRYLREFPDGPDRESAQQSLASVQSAMEQQAAERRVPPPPRPPEVAAEVIERVTKPPAEVARSAVAPARAPYDEGGTTIGIWIVAGVGIAGLVGWGAWMLTKRPSPPKTNRRRRRG